MSRRVVVAYALPHRYFLKTLHLVENTTVESAIKQSGVLETFPDIDLNKNKLGIFGRAVKGDDILQDGDRIEIYRPLLVDPKEIRRKRALEQAKKAQ